VRTVRDIRQVLDALREYGAEIVILDGHDSGDSLSEVARAVAAIEERHRTTRVVVAADVEETGGGSVHLMPKWSSPETLFEHVDPAAPGGSRGSVLRETSA
jgi:hypothetical protein